jgi:hypothetical protein
MPVVIKLEDDSEARRRRELRRYTDLELCVAGSSCRFLMSSGRAIWRQQLQEVIDEWRYRQARRRAGIGLCLCHVPGDKPITATALTWRGSGHDRRLARQFPRLGRYLIACGLALGRGPLL